MPDERHRADGVFEGGGVKGIAFAGAIASAEQDAGVREWVNLAGTSAAAGGLDEGTGTAMADAASTGRTTGAGTSTGVGIATGDSGVTAARTGGVLVTTAVEAASW